MTCYQCENYADRHDVLCGECARNLVKAGAADERERIAAHFHDHTAYTGMYIKEIIRNGEHETGKAKGQAD